MNPEVQEWAFERNVVWYWDPISRKRKRYIPDFDVKLKNGKNLLIEIKPRKETHIPKSGKKKSEKSKRYESFLWKRNQAKWEAAKKYCEKTKKEFIILTEKELFGR